MTLTLEQRFKLAQIYAENKYAQEQYKGQKSMTNEEKLQMYGLGKQASVGPCSKHGGQRPGVFSMVERAKWDAWNALGDMSKEEAMKKYCDKLTAFAPEWENWPPIAEKVKEM